MCVTPASTTSDKEIERVKISSQVHRNVLGWETLFTPRYLLALSSKLKYFKLAKPITKNYPLSFNKVNFIWAEVLTICLTCIKPYSPANFAW